MKILAIDAATSTGWAFLDTQNDGVAPVHGRINLSAGLLKRPTPTHGIRFAAARKEYGDLMERFRPDLVFYECAFPRGNVTTKFLYGLAGIAEGLAHEHGAAFIDMEPDAVRKRMLGHGKPEGGKAAIVAWARSKGFDLDEEQHDEADALLLLALACREARAQPAPAPRGEGGMSLI